MKKGKFLTVLVALVGAVSFALAGASCGKNNGKQTDKNGSAENAVVWQRDEVGHWKDSDKEDGVVVDYGVHSANESGYCNTCAYPMHATPGVEYSVAPEGGSYIVTSYTGTAKDVILEDEYFTLPVSGIAEKAFEGKEITSIRFGSNIKTIAASAFNKCENLDKVYYEGDWKNWIKIAFSNAQANPVYYAHNLYINEVLFTEFILTEEIKTVGDYVFAGAKCLEKIRLHEGVTSVGMQAFENCKNAFTAESGMYYVGTEDNPYYALVDCDYQAQVKNFTMRNDTRLIGGKAFYYVKGLESVICGDELLSIGKNAFENSPIKELTLGKKTQRIEAYAFSFATKLHAVRFGKSLKYIGRYAFENCNALTKAYFDTSNYTINTHWQLISPIGYTKELKSDSFSYPETNAKLLTKDCVFDDWYRYS